MWSEKIIVKVLVAAGILVAAAGVWLIAAKTKPSAAPAPASSSVSSTTGLGTPKPIVAPVGVVVAKGSGYFDMVDQGGGTLRVFTDANTQVEVGLEIKNQDAIQLGDLVVVVQERGGAEGGVRGIIVQILPPPPPLRKI